MEKENLYFNDNSTSPIQVDPLPNCFLNLNWDNPMDQNSPFESALSSIVSSPIASNAAAAPADIRELIGRLGSICNSPIMCGNNSTNTSCYTSPLNSPPKLNLSAGRNLPSLGNSNLTQPNSSSLLADPGFAERAARFSCFGQFGFNDTQFPYHQSTPKMENDKLSRVSSNKSLKAFGSQIINEDEKESALQDGLQMDMRSAYGLSSASNRKFVMSSKTSTHENAEFTNAHEASSGSKQIPGEDAGIKGLNDTNCRKRKAVNRGKAAKDLSSSISANDTKALEETDLNSKRSKSAEEARNENVELSGSSINSAENGDQKQTKSNPKTSEPPRDYIHVRARRGQATDSHSLAERVRREKISERMKLLQDLVPGCNKVTGKAVMLDEIINYVQSLQRQVEFLSMKLANVNPRLDFNMENKDMIQSRESLPYTIYPLDPSASAYNHQPRRESSLPNNVSNGVETQFFVNPNSSMQLPPLDGFGEASASSQVPTFWEDDLQSFVQMGFSQNQLGNGIPIPEFQQ